MKREASFRSDLLKAVKSAFGNLGYCQNNFDPTIRGIPDCEFVIEGNHVAVELKAVDYMPEKGMAFDWGMQPTAIQLNNLLGIARAGGNARVALLVWPIRTVFVRGPEWIFTMRNRSIMPIPGGLGRWNSTSLEARLGGYPWASERTDSAILRQMLTDELVVRVPV